MDLKCVSARGLVSEWEPAGLTRTRTGPPSGGPVRSVRERIGVLPGSGPKGPTLCQWEERLRSFSEQNEQARRAAGRPVSPDRPGRRPAGSGPKTTKAGRSDELEHRHDPGRRAGPPCQSGFSSGFSWICPCLRWDKTF